MGFVVRSVEIAQPLGGIPGNSVHNVTVKGSMVSVDTDFQFYCNDENLVLAGNGDPFPPVLTVPAGHSGVVIPIHYGNPSGSETIYIAASSSLTVDMSNSANWDAHGQATVYHV